MASLDGGVHAPPGHWDGNMFGDSGVEEADSLWGERMSRTLALMVQETGEKRGRHLGEHSEDAPRLVPGQRLPVPKTVPFAVIPLG